MNSKWVLPALACAAGLAQQAPQLSVDHSECTYFGPGSERFQPGVKKGAESAAGRLTRQFTAASSTSGKADRARPFAAATTGTGNLIDQYIYADLQANNITPAGMTTDYEFIRRVTLDLTGRTPVPADVIALTSSLDPNSRAALVDKLLAKPEWVDKWTMFFGDLYKNTQSNTQVSIRAEGRNAFYKYIHDSMAANKPYNQMATEIIAAQGTNSFDQTNGQVNYFPLGIVGGGPTQDIFDNQTANIADQFLGLAHVNCLLCHNGAGHLTTLSLWGSQTTRPQAWELSAFMAHTYTHSIATPKDPNNPNANYNYYSLDKYTTDYALNTTTGNRPPRQPIGTIKTVPPSYLFGCRHAEFGRGLSHRAGAVCHRRFPVCPRGCELHVGGVFRRWHCGSAGSVRPAAARPEQSASRAVDPAAHQREAAECAGAVVYRQRLQCPETTAADRHFRYLSARFGIYYGHLGPGL